MTARILPFPGLTAEQLEMVCSRERLVIGHLGFGRFELFQSESDRLHTQLLHFPRPAWLTTDRERA